MKPFTHVIVFSVAALLWACATTSGPLATGPAVDAAAAKHNAEGIEHYTLGHWDAAKDHFEAAIKADPNLAEPHYNLALTLDRLAGHFLAEATTQFQKAGELAPDNAAITGSRAYRRHVPSGYASYDGTIGGSSLMLRGY